MKSPQNIKISNMRVYMNSLTKRLDKTHKLFHVLHIRARKLKRRKKNEETTSHFPSTLKQLLSYLLIYTSKEEHIPHQQQRGGKSQTIITGNILQGRISNTIYFTQYHSQYITKHSDTHTHQPITVQQICI